MDGDNPTVTTNRNKYNDKNTSGNADTGAGDGAPNPGVADSDIVASSPPISTSAVPANPVVINSATASTTTTNPATANPSATNLTTAMTATNSTAGEGLPSPPSNKLLNEETQSTRPKIRHHSGNPPGVRGIIIDSMNSRDNSPSRGLSPYRSPGGSPRLLNDAGRVFVIPAAGGSPQHRLPASTSDYSLHSGSIETGTRPKTTSMSRDSLRPSSERHTDDHRRSPESRRRYSSSNISTRRGFRPRLSTSESKDRQQEVLDQSEEIMTNYMFERYSRDSVLSSERDVDVPRSPTILENFTQRPQTNTSAVGRRLATIGDEIDARYRTEFKDMTKTLNIREGAINEAYDAFRGVAMRLFYDGISMGRIVALLQFGYHLAIDVLRQGIGDFMADIILWLIRFISVERIRTAASQTMQSIAEWIANQGGWQAAVDGMTEIGNTLADSALYILSFLAASACLVGTAYWLRHR